MNKRNKVRVLIVAISYLFIFSVMSFAASTNPPSGSNPLTVSGTLNTIGDSTLTLSMDFSNIKLDGISLVKINKAVSARMSIAGETLSISPTKYLEGDITYTIKIFTNDGKKYIVNTPAVDTYDYDRHDKRYAGGLETQYPELVQPTGDRVLEIAAKPSEGFNYPYFLLIPAGTADNKDKKYMVVEPNNTGTPTDSFKTHEECVRSALHAHGALSTGAGGFQASTALKTPLLMPVFPRPTTPDGRGIYIHALDKESIMMTGDLARVDLQLIAMIKDAQKLLSSKGITVENKVDMIGFSASGQFVNRFTTLHPDMVKASVFQAFSCFPAAKFNGVDLYYGYGVSDIKQITGQDFNATEYKKVAQFCYMGENDDHDLINPFTDQDRKDYELEQKLFGNKLGMDKWAIRQSMVKQMGFDGYIQFHTYKNIDHGLSDNMYADFIQFFKANTEDTFTKIQAHDNAY